MHVGVAEEILNKCTVNDPQYQNPDDENYTVAFNYEFIEDTSIGNDRYKILVKVTFFFSANIMSRKRCPQTTHDHA